MSKLNNKLLGIATKKGRKNKDGTFTVPVMIKGAFQTKGAALSDIKIGDDVEVIIDTAGQFFFRKFNK
jgi:hypothetical protein